MLRLIEIGGTFENRYGEQLFVLPYFNALQFHDSVAEIAFSKVVLPIQMQKELVCISNNLNVYSNPDLTATVIDHLRYDIVYPDFDTMIKNDSLNTLFNWDIINNWAWIYISTLDSKIKGWVQGKYFFTFDLTNSIKIKKKNNEWKIVCCSLFD